MKKLYFLLPMILASFFINAQSVDYGDVESIFLTNCSSCHGNSGGFTIGFDNMVEVAANQLPTMNRIEPFDPSNSYLYLKLTGDHIGAGGSGNSMPPGGPISSDDLALIEQWINDGALEVISGIEDELVSHNNHQLFQNFPNPVKDQSSIKFFLNNMENINIAVYDLSGRIIENITSGQYSQGLHTVNWNTQNNFDGGLYIIKMEAGTEVHTIKTLIL